MKHLLLIITVIVYSISVTGQSLAKRKVLNTSLSFAKNNDPVSFYSNMDWEVYTNKGNSRGFEISFAKVNNKMLLTGGGIDFVSYSIRNSGNLIKQIVGNGFSISPYLLAQKYIPFSKSKIYYSPSLQAGLFISHYMLNDLDGNGTNSFEISGSSNGFFTKLRPLAVSFIPKRKVIISVSVGEYGFKTVSLNSDVINSPYSSFKLYKKETRTSAGLSLNAISVGVSFLLGKQ